MNEEPSMSPSHGIQIAAMFLCVGCAFALSVSPTSARSSTILKANGPSAAQGLAGLDQSVIDDLVAANRILADQGVLDAFGHISVRDPRDAQHYLMSHWVAPALVTANDISVYDLDSNPVEKSEASRRLYSERYIHGEIYKVRSDVMAIVHTHSPTVVAFGVSGIPFKPILLNAAFLGEIVPVFEIRNQFGADTNLLIDSPGRGMALTEALGGHSVVLMRGHGDVAVGQNIQVAVWNAYYTEVNARVLQQAMSLGGHVTYLSPGEIKTLAEGYARFADRPWQLWKRRVMVENGKAK
jgi:ribulose-5-phosphate 4-epimerase/fuculose-1-phosphate aldolase